MIFRILYGKNIQYNYTIKPLKVGYITGADMMVKCSVLNEVGNFDSDFFMYYEETELSYRISKAGYDIVSIPNAKIIHLEGQSFIIKEERIKKIIHSLKIYDKKTIRNKFYLSLCNFIRILNCRCRIIIFKIIHNQDKLLYWRYWLKYYKD
jgi:GT2 family glycosyltransferase